MQGKVNKIFAFSPKRNEGPSRIAVLTINKQAKNTGINVVLIGGRASAVRSG